jgi:hypothetical protein
MRGAHVFSGGLVIEIQESVLILKSDSSMYAWGCINETTKNVQETLGQK